LNIKEEKKMAKTAVTDKYANVMINTLTESAANTLTFGELPQVTTLLEKKAYLINRVDYAYSLQLLIADTDKFSFGLSLSSRWTDISLSEPSIIDMNEILCIASGAAASLRADDSRVTRDFSTLPGGGILVPTRPLYSFCKGTNLAAAGGLITKIFFTVIDLTPADYWDLVESLQTYS